VSAPLLPILALVILFIGVPWLILHYTAKMKQTSALTPADERMLEDLWIQARDMRRRIEAIEKILDADTSRTSKNPETKDD